MIPAESSPCEHAWRPTRWSCPGWDPSRPHEHGPQRADDEERPERDVRPPPDPARRQEHDEHDPGEEEREDRAGQGALTAGQQPDPDEQLDVAQPERPG